MSHSVADLIFSVALFFITYQAFMLRYMLRSTSWTLLASGCFFFLLAQIIDFVYQFNAAILPYFVGFSCIIYGFHRLRRDLLQALKLAYDPTIPKIIMNQTTVAVAGKPWIISKTLIVGALTVVAGLLQLIVDTFQLSPEANGILMASIGVVVMVLRTITNQPLTSSLTPKTKEAPAPPPYEPPQP